MRRVRCSRLIWRQKSRPPISGQHQIQDDQVHLLAAQQVESFEAPAASRMRQPSDCRVARNRRR